MSEKKLVSNLTRISVQYMFQLSMVKPYDFVTVGTRKEHFASSALTKGVFTTSLKPLLKYLNELIDSNNAIISK